MPQILKPRKISQEGFSEGCFLFFWGLYLKVFIADNVSRLVDPVFSAGPPYIGSVTLLSLYAFSFQIFCDFAGYSKMARGLAKMMGFDLMLNFNLPYFVTNPTDFWKHWHISLSTWLRDYLYIPLGGSKRGVLRTFVNLIVAMFLGGLWHGASWTFVVWGLYHGLLLIIYRILEPLKNFYDIDHFLVTRIISKILGMIVFFHFVTVGWLFFRAQSLTQAIHMMESLSLGVDWHNPFMQKGIKFLMIHVALLLFVQTCSYLKKDPLIVLKFPIFIRVIVYLIIYFSLTLYGAPSGQEFIYFQF